MIYGQQLVLRTADTYVLGIQFLRLYGLQFSECKLIKVWCFRFAQEL